MHELITCTASVLILCLFISQFAADEGMFLKLLQIETMIGQWTKEEIRESDKEKTREDLADSLRNLPWIREVRENGEELEITIDGVIGPSQFMGVDENTVTVKRELGFRVKKEEGNPETEEWRTKEDTDDGEEKSLKQKDENALREGSGEVGE